MIMKIQKKEKQVGNTLSFLKKAKRHVMQLLWSAIKQSSFIVSSLDFRRKGSIFPSSELSSGFFKSV